MKPWYTKHRWLSSALIVFVLCMLGLALTGTLSYPFIMLDRQAQLIARCVFSDPSFVAETYGFSFLAPEDYCILPHRVFPDDASIQIVPRGFYFVWNEYARGTIVSEARASILFDRRTRTRNAEAFLATLKAGGFLDGATMEEHVNVSGLRFVIVRNARGIDGERRFLWAFVDHPEKDISLTILSSRPDEPAVFDALIDGTRTIGPTIKKVP